jgi:hypothetical protein
VLLAFGTVAGCGGGSGSSSGAASPRPTADAGPAGDIPDTQAFVAYTPRSGAYTVKVPEGWARAETASGVTFTDKLNTIAVTTGPVPSAPTSASVRANEVPELRRRGRSFLLRSVTTVTRPAGQAVLAVFEQDGPADPVTARRVRQDVERYELWHDGTLATLTLSSPKGADNVDPWKVVTDSFRWSP